MFVHLPLPPGGKLHSLRFLPEEIRILKHEIRNLAPGPGFNRQNPQALPGRSSFPSRTLDILKFEFVSNFEIRISNLSWDSLDPPAQGGPKNRSKIKPSGSAFR